MKRKLQYFLAASVILGATCCVLVSCKGRHADATPRGETVEVAIQSSEVDYEPLEPTAPSATDAPQSTDTEPTTDKP